MIAARDLRHGMRVFDPTDRGRAFTVDRVEPGSLQHHDGTRSVRVWFTYPYDAERRECHPSYEWETQ